MKKLIPLLLSGALLLGAAGCAGTPATPSKAPAPVVSSTPTAAGTPAPAPANAADVKIAVMLSGPATDGGFCQYGGDAGKAIQATYGYKVDIMEVTTAEQIKSEAANLAEDGYKIVFGHGGEYATPFGEIAVDYPDTWFVTVGGDVVSKNQFPLCLSTEQGGYLCGIVAGMMSETGKLGRIVGGDYPNFMKPGIGFSLGAQSVNPDMKSMVATLSDYDSNEAYENAKVQMQAGADMIFCNANQANSGAIKAVNESTNAYTFGVFGDFSSEAPTKVLLNMITDYNAAYLAATDACIKGISNPAIMELGLATGAVSIVWNPDTKTLVPQEVVDAVNAASDKFISGELDIPNEYELDQAVINTAG